MELEGRPLQMMMDGDHLVIISSINSWNIPRMTLRSIMQTSDGNWRSSNLVKYTVVDISNRSDPNIGRELFIEGSHDGANGQWNRTQCIAHVVSHPRLQTYPSLPSDYWDTESWEDPHGSLEHFN